MRAEERLNYIDVWKGLAILWIVLFHYCDRYLLLYDRDINMSFSHGGEVGVSVFFIFSGFLTYKTLDKLEIQGLKRWFLHKIFRLYPIYALSVIIIFLLLVIIGLPGRDDVNLSKLISNLLFVPIIKNKLIIDSCHWYLFALLKYYIAIAICYKLRIHNKWQLQVAVFLAYIFLLSIDNEKINFFILLNGHVRSVCLGWSLALFIQSRNWGTGFSVLVWIISFLIYGSMFASIVITFLSITILYEKIQKFQNFGWLKYLGRVSYSWYLIHQSIGFVFIYHTKGYIGGNIAVAFACIITLVVSVILHHFIEVPFDSYIKTKVSLCKS